MQTFPYYITPRTSQFLLNSFEKLFPIREKGQLSLGHFSSHGHPFKFVYQLTNQYIPPSPTQNLIVITLWRYNNMVAAIQACPVTLPTPPNYYLQSFSTSALRTKLCCDFTLQQRGLEPKELTESHMVTQPSCLTRILCGETSTVVRENDDGFMVTGSWLVSKGKNRSHDISTLSE